MSASNRRQPTRSARTATARPSNYYAKGSGWSRDAAQQQEPQQEILHGFFPAITHFTDAMAALPKEVMRQFTLLRETEGKGYPFEQAMGEIIDKLKQLPPPPLPQTTSTEQGYFGFSLTNSVNGSAPASVIDGSVPNTQQPPSVDSDESESTVDEHSHTRRAWHNQLRVIMNDMLGALDEKNIVLNSINETLGRQMSRIEGVLPHVEKEVSEEARLGSNTHWALPHMREARKAVTNPNERSRRDMQATSNLAAAAAAVHETDIAAVRSEARREAMGQRRKQNVDSDFDERQPNKRPHATNKAKRPQTGPGYDGRTSTKDQPQKKRRVEKGSMTAEKSMAAPPNGRNNGPRDGQNGLPPQEARKKPRPTPANGQTRKKNLVNSPSLASSPTRGTFATTARRDYSPAAPAQRPTQRARQNSALSVRSTAADYASRSGPSASNQNRPTVDGNRVGTPELRGVANVTGRSMGEAKSAMKDAYTNADGNQMLEQADVHGGFMINNGSSRSLKREDTEPADENGYMDSHIRGGPTRPGVPIQSVEMDGQPMLRARSSRANNGHAPQTKSTNASSPAINTNTFPRRAHERRYPGRSPPPSDLTDHAEDEDGLASELDGQGSSVDETELRYCFCNEPSHGEMVGCDNEHCPREWFHLQCVGLTVAPPESTKWYCGECLEAMKTGAR